MNPLLPSLPCLLLMTSAVLAGTSANYALAPDTVDTGGLRGTSASYTVNASATPGGAGSSPNYTARSGYAGQLLDPAGLGITTSLLTVNEGGTRQLFATLLYDDSTIASLPATAVTWSVHDGPLAGITPSGLATAAAVYQDSAAIARAAYQSFTANLTLTIVDLLPDNFEDYAGDGLPDAWQVQHFGVHHPAAAPAADPDMDGWDNLFEYNACLIPTDPLSTFAMSISETPGGGHQISFSPFTPGCSSYTLLGSNDLVIWTPVTGTITGDGGIRTISDPPGTTGRRFYYIKVQRQ